MNHRLRSILLTLCIAAQIAILGGELVRAQWPLWFGEEITLAIEPVDPRSMFRGQYAQLHYPDLGSLSWDQLPADVSTLQRGQPLWVVLQEQGDVWVPSQITLENPGQRPVIRGRVVSPTEREWDGAIHLRYGIEAYFDSPEDALAIEARVRNEERSVASVRLLGTGRAALVDLLWPHEPS